MKLESFPRRVGIDPAMDGLILQPSAAAATKGGGGRAGPPSSTSVIILPAREAVPVTPASPATAQQQQQVQQVHQVPLPLGLCQNCRRVFQTTVKVGEHLFCTPFGLFCTRFKEQRNFY